MASGTEFGQFSMRPDRCAKIGWKTKLLARAFGFSGSEPDGRAKNLLFRKVLARLSGFTFWVPRTAPNCPDALIHKARLSNVLRTGLSRMAAS